jgi:Cu/Ag efflux pump CusA
MGLAAVTEANTGDFTVKLKAKRSRAIDDVMADVRAQIKATEPALDVEFTQVLQDMIGDLSNAPEPIQIKLFANDPAMLEQLAPRVGDAIGKIDGVVDVQNGIENTISGPAGLHARRSFARRHLDSGWSDGCRSADPKRSPVYDQGALG